MVKGDWVLIEGKYLAQVAYAVDKGVYTEPQNDCWEPISFDKVKLADQTNIDKYEAASKEMYIRDRHTHRVKLGKRLSRLLTGLIGAVRAFFDNDLQTQQYDYHMLELRAKDIEAARVWRKKFDLGGEQNVGT